MSCLRSLQNIFSLRLSCLLYTSSSEVNEALVRQLHRCEFLEDAHNAVLVGGPEPAS